MEQVAALFNWQIAGHVHPFTCGQRDDHPKIDGEKGLLIPTRNGWICPCCDYTQDWAHEFMFQPAALRGDPVMKMIQDMEEAPQLQWSIAVHIEGRDDDYECKVLAPDVLIAVGLALIQANIGAGELVHGIHVGPPKQVGRA